MTIRWEAEACDLGFDPQSGAWLTRLTSSVMSNINIYYEQPYGNADGRRIVYLRAQSSDPRLPPGQQLCVADLKTLKICLVDDMVHSHWVATSPWSGKAAYLRSNGELILLDMDTLEKQILLTHWPLPANAILWSLSPDLRYLVTSIQSADEMFRLIRVDLQQRSWDVIYQHTDIHGHIQINHVNGRDVLLQRNRGMRRDDLGRTRREPSEFPGATHIVVDLHTGKERSMRIGEPWTADSMGHASWVAGTGRMATPANALGAFYVTRDRPTPPRTHDPRHPQGNMVIVGPEDDQPRVFDAPDRCFNHASMSRCGRYFVADDFHNGLGGAVEIVIGDLKTGRCRTLVSNCGAQGGGAASTHPHPYFTADSQRVIYNADPCQVCHLHMAQLPDDFLASLEA
jgi:hypothetical protein